MSRDIEKGKQATKKFAIEKKPMYLCMYAYLCGCYTIMSNNRETISAHMKAAHGWSQQDCDDTMMGDEEITEHGRNRI